MVSSNVSWLALLRLVRVGSLNPFSILQALDIGEWVSISRV